MHGVSQCGEVLDHTKQTGDKVNFTKNACVLCPRPTKQPCTAVRAHQNMRVNKIAHSHTVSPTPTMLHPNTPPHTWQHDYDRGKKNPPTQCKLHTECSRPSATNVVIGSHIAITLPPADGVQLCIHTARLTSQLAPIPCHRVAPCGATDQRRTVVTVHYGSKTK